jgi:hypothetical protein
MMGNPLAFIRMIGFRYMHLALVVTHEDKPHVLEWRGCDLFKGYEVAKSKIGIINLVPLETYFEKINQKGAIFRLYHPPRPMRLTYKKEIVDRIKDNYTICSKFATEYFNHSVKRGINPFLYLPENCISELTQRNWKEEYCVDT